MRKKIFIIFVLLALSHTDVFSQETDAEYRFEMGQSGSVGEITGFHVGVNGNVLFPTGLFSNYYSSGIGVGLFARYITSANLAIGAAANIDILRFRQGVIPGVTTSFRTLVAMVEYYFDTGSTPYIGLDFGHYTLTTSVAANTVGTPVSANISQSALGMGPYLGYILPISSSLFMNGNIKYTRTFSSLIGPNIPTQYIQLNIGLSYKF